MVRLRGRSRSASWKTPEALELMRSFKPDLCVMAYVTLFVPQAVVEALRKIDATPA